MDNDFDNVTWQNDIDPPTPSAPQSEPQGAAPRPELNGRRASTAQAGPGADAVDLAGVGDGELQCTVSSPLKENDGSKDAYVSYLVFTEVRLSNLS